MLPTQAHYIQIMQRLSADQSRLQQFIKWYGQQGQLFKFGLGLGIACLGALIGALMQMSLVLSLLSSALYFLFHRFMQKEYDQQLNAEQSLSANIAQLEGQLNTSLSRVQNLEAQVQQVSTTLQTEIQTNILAYTSETSLLKEKNQALEKTILALNQSNNDLIAKNEHISQKLYDQIEKLNHIQKNIASDAEELSHITLQFRQNQQPFIEDAAIKLAEAQNNLEHDLQAIEQDDLLFERVMSQRNQRTMDTPRTSIQ